MTICVSTNLAASYKVKINIPRAKIKLWNWKQVNDICTINNLKDKWMSIKYVDGHKNAISLQASSRSCERYLSNVMKNY